MLIFVSCMNKNVKGSLFPTQTKHHSQLQLLRFTFKSNYFQTSKCSSPRSSSLLPLLLALWACQLVRNKTITISSSTVLTISPVANIEALAAREPEPHLTDADVDCKRNAGNADEYYQTGCWINGFCWIEDLLSDLRRRSASSSKRGSKSVSCPGYFF